jgi:TonB family protein
MHKLLVAVLSLSSFTLLAQAQTPATAKRISTGVIAPKLIYKVDVVADPSATRFLQNDTTVVVGMIVDKAGKPEDLKIIRSSGTGLDTNVLAAVSQYRFTPGTVSNEPVATPLNLEVVIANENR